nr:immunoglobulin light chain junction region [Macaca mulatta]
EYYCWLYYSGEWVF